MSAPRTIHVGVALEISDEDVTPEKVAELVMDFLASMPEGIELDQVVGCIDDTWVIDTEGIVR